MKLFTLRRKLLLLSFVAIAVLIVIVRFLAREEFRHPGYLEGLLLNPRFALREYQYRMPFDSKVWENPATLPDVQMNPGRLTARIRMIDDFLDRHALVGKSRAEIDSLLGPRTKTEYFGEWDLVYYLGPGRCGNAIGDSEWLVIRFDAKDCVKEYTVVHD